MVHSQWKFTTKGLYLASSEANYHLTAICIGVYTIRIRIVRIKKSKLDMETILPKQNLRNSKEERSNQGANNNLLSNFNSSFLGAQEENRLQKARGVLGESVKDVPDQILNAFITELQYLADSWLDDYEKGVFGDKTLTELLKGNKYEPAK